MDYHAYFHGEERPETDCDPGDEDDAPARQDADVQRSLAEESARELAWLYRMGELP
jgi:hypothetical protein